MNRLGLFGLVMALACFGCGDDDGPGDVDSGGVDSGPTVDSGPGDDTGPGDDAGPTDDAGPGDDAGPTEDAGPMADAGPMRDVGPMRDAGGSVGVMCGDMTCSATEQCCIMGIGSAGTCIPRGDSCTGASIACDGPEDCDAGEVCCGRAGGGGGGAACADSCGGPGGGGFELCHEMSDCSDGADMCCPAGDFVPADGFCSEFCFGGP